MITQKYFKKYILKRNSTDISGACLPAGPAVGGTGKDLPRILLGVTVFFLFCLVGVGQTQEGKDKPKAQSTTKEITGEVSMIDKRYIAVVYERDLEKGIEYEVLLPIDEGLKVERKKSLSELNIGDTISIKYEETVEDSKEGQKMSRKAKVVSFVRPAAKKPEPVELETTVLDSGAPGEERLSIKGIKGQ